MRVREGEHPRGDTGQLLLLGVFLVVWAGDSFAWHGTTALADRIPLPARLLACAVVLVAAALLIRAGHAAIAHDRPPGIVSTGAFRYVRHPLYLGSILFYLGLVVSTASLAALALTALIAVFYDRIASYEESWLERRYGEAYAEYRARSGKWWPARRRARPPGATR
jgi:protein-S-isoprenylcysteine O-methyltransferase Ste14